MPSRSPTQVYADDVDASLEALGQRMRVARLRRGDSQGLMAERIGVSLRTYQSMEAGSKDTSIGNYLAAFVVFGWTAQFDKVGHPADDEAALRAEIANLGSRAPRRPRL